MQISSQEVTKLQQAVKPSRSEVEEPVRNVAELAARHGVRMEEVSRVAERLRLSEDDVARERRVQELARRVADGRYEIGAESVIDMAERRAIADRSARG